MNLVLPVLREINYLSNTEFRDLELKVKGLEEQPSPVRLKLKGDALVSHEKYIKAIEVYTATMALRKEANLGSQFLGSVYNNMGCAYARLFQMEEACDCFHHAYEELHTRATLKSYLYAVYMKSGEEAYEKAGEDLGIDPATRVEMDTPDCFCRTGGTAGAPGSGAGRNGNTGITRVEYRVCDRTLRQGTGKPVPDRQCIQLAGDELR